MPASHLVSKGTFDTVMHVMVDTTGVAQPRSFVLQEGKPHLIGREDGCDVVIASDTVSRRHASVSVHNGTISVRDLGSSNGTWLDGAQVTDGEWKTSQELRIGPARFRVEPEASEQDTVVLPTSNQARSRRSDDKQGSSPNQSADRRQNRNFVGAHWRGGHGLFRTVAVNILVLGLVYSLLALAILGLLVNDLSPFGRRVLISAETAATLAFAIWQLLGLIRAIKAAKSRGVGARYRWLAGLFALVPIAIAILAVLTWIGTNIRLSRVETGMGNDGRPVYSLTVRNNALVFDGQVVWPIVQDVGRRLDTNPAIRTIFLRSPGGDVVAARRVNDLLRRRSMTTWVTEFCHSACTIMYAAGSRRVASARAQIGFHATSIILMDAMMTRIMNALTFRQDRQNANYYLNAGFDRAFVERAVATPSSDLLVLPPGELQRLGVVTQVVR